MAEDGWGVEGCLKWGGGRQEGHIAERKGMIDLRVRSRWSWWIGRYPQEAHLQHNQKADVRMGVHPIDNTVTLPLTQWSGTGLLLH